MTTIFPITTPQSEKDLAHLMFVHLKKDDVEGAKKVYEYWHGTFDNEDEEEE